TAVAGSGAKVGEVGEDLFRSIADTDSPQGIAVICDRPGTGQKDFEERFNLSNEQIPLVIFLEEVNNPSNLGAIVRTAEAAGAAGVIVSKGSADPFSAKAVRASMGSAFRLPVWSGVDLGTAVTWAGERGMIVTAADIDGDKIYTHIDWRKPRLLVFGSEAHGLSDAHKNKVEDLITIPTSANVESLNLAVSAGVILFEAKRQIET
ncbi:MAG: TrmH family RNA methyltransferase, partial [Candidatus Binatia bacterium]